MARIKLPYAYKDTDGRPFELLGWKNCDCETGRLVVKAVEDETEFILPTTRSFELLNRLGLAPKQVPTKQVEVITGKDWGKFSRFMDYAKEIEDGADETLSNWKHHLRWLSQEFSFHDNDNEMEDFDNAIRNIVRLMKFIRTGHMPPDDMDDDDYAYYDDDVLNYRQDRSSYGHSTYTYVKPRAKKVIVHIEDISTGDL